MSAVVEPHVVFEHPATVTHGRAGRPNRVRFREVPEHRLVMSDG